jgi:hypothetical protein
MSKCETCGASVNFAPHPKNPNRSVPFNSDGEIHFATCSSRKTDFRITNLMQMRCSRGHGFKYLQWHEFKNGERHLRAVCEMDHFMKYIPQTDSILSYIKKFPNILVPEFFHGKKIQKELNNIKEMKLFKDELEKQSQHMKSIMNEGRQAKWHIGKDFVEDPNFVDDGKPPWD